jgi:oligosaccharide reducing-end xylanase
MVDHKWDFTQTMSQDMEVAHTSTSSRGFFSWSMRTDGTPNDEMPVPDVEEHFAMSLYLAAGRWGNGTGIYDYQAAVDRLLSDMRHSEVITGPTSRGIRTAGNMFQPDYAMIRFTLGTDPMPHSAVRHGS